MAELNYLELSKAKIGEHEDVIISQTTRDGEEIGYSVSRCTNARVGDKEVKMFLKRGLGIMSESSLLNLYNAIGDALVQIGTIEYGRAIEAETERVEEEEKRFNDLGEDDKYW